jgi:hypothetical protein
MVPRVRQVIAQTKALPATAGGIFCLRRPWRTPEELIFAPESWLS